MTPIVPKIPSVQRNNSSAMKNSYIPKGARDSSNVAKSGSPGAGQVKYRTAATAGKVNADKGTVEGMKYVFEVEVHEILEECAGKGPYELAMWATNVTKKCGRATLSHFLYTTMLEKAAVFRFYESTELKDRARGFFTSVIICPDESHRLGHKVVITVGKDLAQLHHMLKNALLFRQRRDDIDILHRIREHIALGRPPA